MKIFDWLKAHKKTLYSKKEPKLSPQAQTVVWLLFIALILIVLKYVNNVIQPFIWAIITAYLFHPMVHFLEKKAKIPRVIWILFVYLLIGFLVYWGVSVLAPVINMELAEFVSLPAQGGTGLFSRLAQAGQVNFLGFNINIRDGVSQLQQLVIKNAQNFALPMFVSTVEWVLLALLYFIFTFYILLDGEKYIKLFLVLIPSRYRREVTTLGRNINETLGAYIRGLIILIFIMGINAWIILFALHVNYSILLSVATGVLEVIPLIGPIIATTLVALVALYQPSVAYGLTNLSLMAILIVCYFILRQIEDYLIIPAVVGKFIHVHPVMVIFSVLIGAKIAGILGVFLALPVAAVLKILFYYFYPKLT